MPSSHTYAIFSARYAPLTGGIESFTQRLAHELATVGNRVIIVTSKLRTESPDREMQDDGVEVLRLPAWSFLGDRLPISRRSKEHRRLLDELASEGVDRVLVNARFYRHSLEGVRFAKRLGVPVVVLDHGSAHLTIGNKVADWFVEHFEHAVTRRMKDLAPSFAGISKASVKWLEHFDIFTTSVIPNAIDVEAFCSGASQRSFRDGLGIGCERAVIAFVGRLEQEKGAIEMMHAMELLDERYICLMAGDGSLRAKLEEQSGENVILLGRIGHSDLSALLRDADIFCLPSRSEGFCTSLLEAAAQDVMPVMPHVGGTDEVMGWDPVEFGVGIATTESEHIAEGIRSAARIVQETGNGIKDHVSECCSWKTTMSALEASFETI